MRSVKRLGTGLATLTALLLTAVFYCGVQPAAAQALRETVKPLVIKDIVGKDTVRVGDVETYRVKVNAPRDVEYRWHANGSTSLGNPIVHRFDRPGRVEIVVVARNVRSTVSDTFSVTVLGEEPVGMAATQPSDQPPTGSRGEEARRSARSSTPAAEDSRPTGAGAEAGEVDPAESARTGSGFQGSGRPSEDGQGYTWVIATYFQKPSAVALANSYRASGYRAGVITDKSGQGSQVYRVILGEFQSQESALRAKRYLINAGHKNVLLRELGRRG